MDGQVKGGEGDAGSTSVHWSQKMQNIHNGLCHFYHQQVFFPVFMYIYVQYRQENWLQLCSWNDAFIKP